MTVSEIIDGVLDREGEAYTWNQAAGDPPTKWGVTPEPLGAYRRLGRPATPEEVQTVDRGEAHAILLEQYVIAPGFIELPDPLRAQLTDFGFNSGPGRAIRWLQRIAHLPITGCMDVLTRDAITAIGAAGHLHLLSNALVAGRLEMVDRWTDADARKKVFEEGLESRALVFLDYDRSTL